MTYKTLITTAVAFAFIIALSAQTVVHTLPPTPGAPHSLYTLAKWHKRGD